MIKELLRNKMIDMDHFSENIEKYIKYSLKVCDSIYLYKIDILTEEQSKKYDKLSWIRSIEHEEYEKIKLVWYDGKETFYQSEQQSDMVIKLNLEDFNVRKIFEQKFKVGTCWARGDLACKIGENDRLFDMNPGYEFYNFVLAKKDEVILDAWLHGGFDIAISKDIILRANLEKNNESVRDGR